jgi:GDP-mannose 6-dehydrogenase
VAQVGKGERVKINIFGLGYVGSVSAACLASEGHEVRGIDIDRTKVDSIKRGESPVIEPGLPELMKTAVGSGRLTASTDIVDGADLSIVCVGTPSNENGSLGLTYLSRATEQIGAFLRTARAYHVVCIRSTVLPGTVEGHVVPILERQSRRRPGPDFGVCMNPEFLREGSSIRDYHAPPFTIIGELDSRSGDVLEALYAKVPAPMVRTRLAVAEMVKYAGNAFHALKITFANEIGNLAKRLGVDGTEVMEIFCRDQKLNIAPSYLQPGFAFGGSCLPKDLRALLYKAKELDLEPAVLRAILTSNADPHRQGLPGGDLRSRRVARPPPWLEPRLHRPDDPPHLLPDEDVDRRRHRRVGGDRRRQARAGVRGAPPPRRRRQGHHRPREGAAPAQR